MALDRCTGTPKSRPRSRSRRAIALESRLLFDGAGIATVDHLATAEHQLSVVRPTQALEAQLASDVPHEAPALKPLDSSQEARQAIAASGLTDLLVIDTRVTDWQSIAAAAGPQVEVLVLDPNREGFEQIADELAAHDGLKSVQIVSHGEAGKVALGSSWVGEADLGRFQQSLSRIDASLADGADLMLYGCDIGQGDAGASFLAALAQAAHLDVAASTDDTGGLAAGGNWTLEAQIGSIEAKLAINSQVARDSAGLLAPGPSVTLRTPDVGGAAGSTNDILLGEQFTVTATFDNTSAVATDTGYAPYFDLYVPRAGVDNGGGALRDGVTIDSISYLGAPLTTQTITLTAADISNDYYTHPFVDQPGNPLGAANRIALPPGMQAGDEIIIVTVPYGSYTANQPASDLTISGTLSNRADPNAPSSTVNSLNLRARAGFRYGADPLDNAASDPTIIGAVSAQQINPILYRTRTTYIGPEDETATGPNYQRAYRIDVDIAEGIRMSNLQLGSVLDPAMQFSPITGTPNNIGGYDVGAAPAGGFGNVGGVLISNGGIGGGDPTAPGGTVARMIGTATGTAAKIDASMVVGFYVPEVDASSAVVIDPVSGDKVNLTHGTQLSASSYTPVDTRDAGSAQSTVLANSHQLEADSIAIQKLRAITNDVGLVGVSPGDTLRYDLNLQVSDYFAFGGNLGGNPGDTDFLVTDTMSDGIQFLDAATSPSAGNPSLTVMRADGSSYTIASLNAADYTIALQPDGRQVLVVNVRAALVRDGQSALLVGDQFGADNTQNNGMSAQISFNARVLESYRSQAPDETGAPSASSSAQLQLNEGDRIVNNALVQATVLDAALNPAAPGLQSETEDTRQSDRIPVNAVSLNLVGINGTPVTNSFATPIKVVPGDDISYVIEYTVPTGDYENFHLTGYMPLPVFSVVVPDDNGAPNGFGAAGGAYTMTPVVSQFSVEAISGVSTPVTLTPTVSIDGPTNAIDFDFGNRVDATNEPLRVRVSFTLRANDEAFADGLFLTGQAQAADDDTTTLAQTSQAIDRFELTQPNVNIHKGIVRDENGANGQILTDDTSTVVAETGLIKPAGDTSNPLSGTVTSATALSLDTDIRRVDSTDQIRYAVVLENTGSSQNGAFDVAIRDVLPFSQTVSDVSNLRATMGDGTVLDYTGANLVRNGATGVAITTEAGFKAALFGPDGVKFVDPSPTQGRIGSGEDASGNPVTNGSNVLVVSYDLRLPADADARATATTSATLFNYAAIDGDTSGHGAADYTPADLSEEATVTIAGANDGPVAVADFNSVPAASSMPATGNIIDGGSPLDARDTDINAVTTPDVLTVQGVVAGDNGAVTVCSGGVGTAIPGSWGSVVVNPDGSYRYTVDQANPAVIALPPGSTLQDVYTYSINDGHGGVATTTLTITINGVEEAPDGVDRVWPLTEDTPVRFQQTDFGFTDPDTGDSLSGVRIDTLPLSGRLMLNGAPVTAGQLIDPAQLANLAYEPAINANRLNLSAPPRFTYSNRDSRGNFDPVPNTFGFDIAPVNDPPIAPLIVRTIPYTARAGSIEARVLDTPLPSDPDVPLDTLTITVTGLPATQGGSFLLADGTPVVQGQNLSFAQLQSLQFVPNPGNTALPVNGLIPAGQLSYQVTDGSGGGAEGVIRINTTPPVVAQLPVIQPASDSTIPLLDTVLPDRPVARVGAGSTPVVEPFNDATREGVVSVDGPNPTPVQTGTSAAPVAAGNAPLGDAGRHDLLGYSQASDLDGGGFFMPNRIDSQFGNEVLGWQPGDDRTMLAKGVTATTRTRAAPTEAKDLDCIPARTEVKARPMVKRSVFADQLPARPKSFTEQVDKERKRLQLPKAVKPRPVLPPC